MLVDLAIEDFAESDGILVIVRQGRGVFFHVSEPKVNLIKK